MGEVTWTAYESASTLLSTELNSLANGSESAQGGAFDNSTNRDMVMDLYLVLASLNPTTGAHVVINDYLSVDGTNYPDLPTQIYKMLIETGSAAKHQTLSGLVIRPGLHKFTITNECNVAFGATDNSLNGRAYSPTVA